MYKLQENNKLSKYSKLLIKVKNSYQLDFPSFYSHFLQIGFFTTKENQQPQIQFNNIDFYCLFLALLPEVDFIEFFPLNEAVHVMQDLHPKVKDVFESVCQWEKIRSEAWAKQTDNLDNEEFIKWQNYLRTKISSEARS